MKMAGIEQDVKFIGMGDTIEIWSNSKIEEATIDAEEFGNALEELMGTNSL